MSRLLTPPPRIAAPVRRAVGRLRSLPFRGGEPGGLPAAGGDAGTAVDRYWSRHTVRAKTFRSPRQSRRFLEWRFRQYPLFREFCELWGEHDGEVVLDYGCGPGNDVVGLAVNTGARRIIGIDVSPSALELARRRLALHDVDPERVELINTTDGDPSIPLETSSVDYLQSLGVLHHTSEPAAILRELERVLRPGGRACVMVYNRDSVWFHLYTAYERMIRQGDFPGCDVHDAFARNTDGEDCPISRSYQAGEFLGLCGEAGFEGRFVGGYLSKRELQSLRDSFADALADDRLGDEHRDFLRSLDRDPAGLPMHGGFHAGIGGVYHLRKRATA